MREEWRQCGGGVGGELSACAREAARFGLDRVLEEAIAKVFEI